MVRRELDFLDGEGVAHESQDGLIDCCAQVENFDHVVGASCGDEILILIEING